jgi:hypothetical protein
MTEISYSITETSGSQARERLSSMLTTLAEKAGQTLQAAINDASSLEVITYVSDDMGQVTYDVTTRQLSGSVKVRAMTRVSIDGDTVVCVPEKAGDVDTAVLQIHNEMVKQARATRSELIQTAFTAATGLLERMRTQE